MYIYIYIHVNARVECRCVCGMDVRRCDQMHVRDGFNYALTNRDVFFDVLTNFALILLCPN